MLFVIFIPTTFTHFILTFLKIDHHNYKRTNLFNYIISSFLGLTVYTQWFAKDIGPFLVFPYWLKPNILFYVHMIHFFGNVIYSHFLMWRSLRHETGAVRNQILYVLIGTGIGYAGGALNYLTWCRVPVPPFLNPLVSFYVAFVSYAIIKYRLMDITIALTRTAILLIVYGIIFAVSLILSTVFKPGLMQLVGDNWWLIPVVIYTVAITLAPFLYLQLQKRAEARILKNQRHHHAIIMTAARNISLIRDLDKVLKLLAIILTKTLGIASANVYLLDRAKKQYCLRVARGGKTSEATIDLGNSLVKYLQGVRRALIYEEVKTEYEDRRDIFIKEIRDTMLRINADLLVPSFIEDELVGFLALGIKKTGEVYTIEDIKVLSSLANQSALAIENAQFLKEREEMQGKLREVETLTTIRDLLGSFNHEIYNLLTPVSGTLQGINMGNYATKPEKMKADVERSIAITFFIKTYLGWVREYVESGDQIAAYQLSDLINGGISYSKEKLEKQNIKTEVSVDPKLFIVGYPSLVLIFRHLILHSVYGYGMEEGGTIRISAHVLEDGATIEIIQIDTGDDLTKYLEEGSTMGGKKFAEKGKLGGVSYFIAQAVVTKHKGSFRVEPTGGKGTKFNIRLPIDVTKVSA
jgi:K+-sensing histidine kinase KdpD